jgi:hypothetical protein
VIRASIDWQYLPALPPEPEDEISALDYLVATNDTETGESGVAWAWYAGDGQWINADGYYKDDVYAWAPWLSPPPAQEVSE